MVNLGRKSSKEKYMVSLRMEMAFGLTGLRKYLEYGDKKWVECFFDIEKQLKKNKNYKGYAFPPLEYIIEKSDVREEILNNFEILFKTARSVKSEKIKSDELKSRIKLGEELLSTLENIDTRSNPDSYSETLCQM